MPRISIFLTIDAYRDGSNILILTMNPDYILDPDNHDYDSELDNGVVYDA